MQDKQASEQNNSMTSKNKNMIDFSQALIELNEVSGINIKKPAASYVRVTNAKELLQQALKAKLGTDPQWTEAFDKVAEWLINNNGKSLLLAGNCGCGKTLVAFYALPLIFLHRYGIYVKVLSATEVAKNIDNILQTKMPVVLDDLGTEEPAMEYGQRRFPIDELIDHAEKTGRLLIITTNLNKAEITQKYGDRVADRLSAFTTVVFTGNSHRK